MLAKLSVDQMLMKAKSHVKRDEILDAKKLYQAVLITFPKNKRAQQGLDSLNQLGLNNTRQSPPQEMIDQLINLYNQGQLFAMIEQAQVLIEQYPDAFILWNCLGVANIDLGRTEQALIALTKVTELNPNYAEGFNNLSVALQDQGKLDKAIEACNKAILLKPNYVDAFYNLGNFLNDQCKFDKAIKAYNKVISLKPNYAKVYNNMGVAFHDQFKFDQALNSFNMALSLKFVTADVYYNMGRTFKYLGKLEEAIEACNKSISLDPNHVEAHQSLCYSLIQKGKLKEGFEEYEWRWKTQIQLGHQRHFSQPLWDGKKSLKGKRILIWSEQGIGDTIMWSSRLSLLTSQADHCIFECQEKLVPLLKRSFPNVEVKPQNRSFDLERVDFDYHLPMGNLYKHFIDDILQNTKAGTHLVPDQVRVNFWRTRLNSLGTGPYIGISWKSSNMELTRLPNYAPISELSPILTLPNITFINMQSADFKDDLAKIQNELGVRVHNFDDLDHFNNIDDVAALITALDFVVSTKTAVPLISAGVGTPTKLANWRQSPWNNILMNPAGSSVDIFERDTSEPWDRVFNLIAEDILQLTKS